MIIQTTLAGSTGTVTVIKINNSSPSTDDGLLNVQVNLTDLLQGGKLTINCSRNNCSNKKFTLDFWALTPKEAKNFVNRFHNKREETFTYGKVTLSNRFRQFLLKNNKDNIFQYPKDKKITVSKDSEYWASSKVKKGDLVRANNNFCNDDDELSVCAKKIWTNNKNASGEPTLKNYIEFINKINKENNLDFEFYVALETKTSSGFVPSAPVKISGSDSGSDLVAEIPFDLRDYSGCGSCFSLKHCLACIDKKIVVGVWSN